MYCKWETCGKMKKAAEILVEINMISAHATRLCIWKFDEFKSQIATKTFSNFSKFYFQK